MRIVKHSQNACLNTVHQVSSLFGKYPSPETVFLLQVVELQEELEDQGTAKAEVEARCLELRRQLLQQVEQGGAVDITTSKMREMPGPPDTAEPPERRRGRDVSDRDHGRSERSSHDQERGGAEKGRSRTERCGDGGRSRDSRADPDVRRSERYRRETGPDDHSAGRYARGSRTGREDSIERDASRSRGRVRDRGREERSRDYDRGTDRGHDRDRERSDRDRKRARR